MDKRQSRQATVLRLIRREPGMSVTQLSLKLGESITTVRDRIRCLACDDLIIIDSMEGFIKVYPSQQD